MKINDLQVIVRFKRRSNAERALSRAIDQGVWEAVQRIKSEHGEDLAKWPSHFMAILGDVEPAPAAAKEVVKVNFADLTDEDKSFIKGVHSSDRPQTEKERLMYERFGIASRTCDHWYKRLGLTSPPEEPDFLVAAKNRDAPVKKYVLLTSAQNATPIHKGLWDNMLAYAKFLDADIRVIPLRYKNPTSVFQDLDHDFWAPELILYLDRTNHRLAENLVILGKLKVQPTADFPLQGIHAITNGQTSIIGHPKMHMTTVPVLEGEHKQRLWTTGSVTVENYTDSKAGSKGESHHIFGFCIVEIDEDRFHVRQVPATDSGDFIDLWNVVSAGEVGFSDKITAAVLGDMHLGDTDERKLGSTLDLLNMLVPEHIILHDLFNGHSVNHHEAKDPVKAYHRIQKGRNLLEDEITEMLDWLHWFTQEFSSSEIVVVRSNHCQFLDRYISDQNWKNDVHNAAWYIKCLDHLLQNPDTKGLVPYFIEQIFGDRVTCLTRDDSYRPGTYQLASHGDLGTNGSKGTPLQYSKMNAKQVTGHTHSPSRINGLLVTGTSTKLRLDYNIGPSSWAHADVIEYKNGKATHIIYDENYQFTTQKYPFQ